MEESGSVGQQQQQEQLQQQQQQVLQANRLPPGFRFHPTDEELVLHYLRRKVHGVLPASVITDVDLTKNDPWDLPGDPKNERYFFNYREVKYRNGNRQNRAAATGYWKATGRDKAVISPKCNNKLVGMKKVLVFYQGKPQHGLRTDWIIHEYRLAGILESEEIKANSTNRSAEVGRDWVVFRIFKKIRGTKSDMDTEESGDDARGRSNGIRFIDFMGRDRKRRQNSPSSSSTDSSCLTDNTSEGSSNVSEVSNSNMEDSTTYSKGP